MNRLTTSGTDFRKRLILHRLHTAFALFLNIFDPNHRNYNPDQTAKLPVLGSLLDPEPWSPSSRNGGWNKATILLVMQKQSSFPFFDPHQSLGTANADAISINHFN